MAHDDDDDDITISFTSPLIHLRDRLLFIYADYRGNSSVTFNPLSIYLYLIYILSIWLIGCIPPPRYEETPPEEEEEGSKDEASESVKKNQ